MYSFLPENLTYNQKGVSYELPIHVISTSHVGFAASPSSSVTQIF